MWSLLLSSSICPAAFKEHFTAVFRRFAWSHPAHDEEVNGALRILMGLSELGVEGEVTMAKFSGLLDSLGEQTQENTTNMEELKVV